MIVHRNRDISVNVPNSLILNEQQLRRFNSKMFLSIKQTFVIASNSKFDNKNFQARGLLSLTMPNVLTSKDISMHFISKTIDNSLIFVVVKNSSRLNLVAESEQNFENISKY